MLIGYARVSTQDQNLDLQTEALAKAGCKKIFDDKISGATPRDRGSLKCRKPSAMATHWSCGNSTDWAAAASILSTSSANCTSGACSSKA